MVNYDAITYIIKRITEINGEPCKKTLQKLVFLIEAKRVDIGCKYGIHFYGPYSADLDYAVRELCDKGILKIDYTPMEHRISVIDDSGLGDYSNETVNNILSFFGKETPSELELIATALYVYMERGDKDKIITGVKKLKGAKFSDARIDMAVSKLVDLGYISI